MGGNLSSSVFGKGGGHRGLQINVMTISDLGQLCLRESRTYTCPMAVNLGENRKEERGAGMQDSVLCCDREQLLGAVHRFVERFCF